MMPAHVVVPCQTSALSCATRRRVVNVLSAAFASVHESSINCTAAALTNGVETATVGTVPELPLPDEEDVPEDAAEPVLEEPELVVPDPDELEPLEPELLELATVELEPLAPAPDELPLVELVPLEPDPEVVPPVEPEPADAIPVEDEPVDPPRPAAFKAAVAAAVRTAKNCCAATCAFEACVANASALRAAVAVVLTTFVVAGEFGCARATAAAAAAWVAAAPAAVAAALAVLKRACANCCA